MQNKQTVAVLIVAIAIVVGGVYLYTGEQTETCLAGSEDCEIAVLEKVGVEEFEAMAFREGYTVIDLRTPEETAAGKITADALEIDFYDNDFATKLAELDRTTPYLIYCRSGNRSGQTLKTMEELGFTEVYDLKGGIGAWQASGRHLMLE